MSIPSFTPNRQTVQLKSFKPLPNRLFVTDMDRGEKKTKSGLIVIDDNGTDRGIRPRWAKVWAIGEGVQDIEVGQWILIEHGRWSFKMTFEFEGQDEAVNVWQVDYLGDHIMLVSDTPPLED
jgi:hypothetical protein